MRDIFCSFYDQYSTRSTPTLSGQNALDIVQLEDLGDVAFSKSGVTAAVLYYLIRASL